MSEDSDFYWDWIKHEDNTFTNRGNFFLVAESMLLAAMATLAAASTPPRDLLTPIVASGLLITLIWLYINCRHIFVTQSAVKSKLKAVEPRWAIVAKGRVKWFPNHMMIGVVLPIMLLITWFLVARAVAGS